MLSSSSVIVSAASGTDAADVTAMPAGASNPEEIKELLMVARWWRCIRQSCCCERDRLAGDRVIDMARFATRPIFGREERIQFRDSGGRVVPESECWRVGVMVDLIPAAAQASRRICRDQRSRLEGHGHRPRLQVVREIVRGSNWPNGTGADQHFEKPWLRCRSVIRSLSNGRRQHRRFIKRRDVD